MSARDRPAPIRATRLHRWALVVAALLMAAVLASSVWNTHRGVHDALATVEQDRSSLLQAAIGAALAARDRAPTTAELAAIRDQLAAQGVASIAVIGPDGAVLAAAGEPPARRAPADRGIFVGVEPRPMAELHDLAHENGALGAIAATAFVLLGLVVFRYGRHREALERRLEHGRRLASLGQMSAVLAHEIRNPLTSLKGHAQLLARALPEGDPTRVKADLVIEEAVRLEHLTRDLLEFARTGAIRREPVDPAALLRDAAASAAPDRVRVDDRAAPARWALDPERIRQVLLNLLENAAAAADGPVEARVHEQAGRLVYTVRDRGPGLPAADLDRIFEPFYTTRASGTGLGLAVSRRIVELHGGTIAARNVTGGGAELTVELPGA